MSENTFKTGSQALARLASYFASSLSIAYIENLLSVSKFKCLNLDEKRTGISFCTEDIRPATDESRPNYTNTSWNVVIRIFCNLNKIAVLLAPISPYLSISRMNYPILNQRKIYFFLLHFYPLLAMSICLLWIPTKYNYLLCKYM